MSLAVRRLLVPLLLVVASVAVADDETDRCYDRCEGTLACARNATDCAAGCTAGRRRLEQEFQDAAARTVARCEKGSAAECEAAKAELSRFERDFERRLERQSEGCSDGCQRQEDQCDARLEACRDRC